MSLDDFLNWRDRKLGGRKPEPEKDSEFGLAPSRPIEVIEHGTASTSVVKQLTENAREALFKVLGKRG